MVKSRKTCLLCKTTKGADLTYHRFPSTPRMAKKWCDALGLNINHLPKYAYVCAKHFRKEDLIMGLERINVSKSAIPISSVSMRRTSLEHGFNDNSDTDTASSESETASCRIRTASDMEYGERYNLSSNNKRFIFVGSVKSEEKMGLQLREVIKKLENIAPLKTAESWDNVGLLVEPDSEARISSLLLTIDLTEDVVQEAVKLGAQLIVSYHPNIFKPLKSVTQSGWKERIIVQCIKNNIAVFSPHTSWDAMQNGVNDWLGSGLSPLLSSKPILANKDQESIGMGRLLVLETDISLGQVIHRIKKHVGLPHLRLGLAKGKSLESMISTVALCAGSGASVLSGVEADLYLTGEMLHHDVLDATQKGISVILCNHSDSERGYLKTFQQLFANEQLSVHVSNVDKDCLTTV